MKTMTSRQKGATLIEVLVAMIILAIGLLGIAGMQTTSVKANQSSYFRSQSTLLAADIVDRMRANRTIALTGAYNITTAPDSATNRAVTGSRAEKDMAQWLNQVGSSLPDGTATITLDSGVFTIGVQWNDKRGKIDAANTDAAVQTFYYRVRL